MPPNTLNAALLILALLLFLSACKNLIDDARSGPYITMGAEMYFNQLWTLASLLSVTGSIRLFALSWWLFIPGLIGLYCLSLPLRRVIESLFLGVDEAPPEKKGFKEFEKSIKEEKWKSK